MTPVKSKTAGDTYTVGRTKYLNSLCLFLHHFLSPIWEHRTVVSVRGSSVVEYSVVVIRTGELDRT